MSGKSRPRHPVRPSPLRPSQRALIATPVLTAGVLGLGVLAAPVSHAADRPAGTAGTSTAAAAASVRTVVQELPFVPVAQRPMRVARRVVIEKRSWTLPVTGYHLTGRFGDVSGLWSSVHTGLDFAAPEGTPIRAIADGVVLSTAYDGSYGNKTVIRLDDGTELWYCHQSSFAVAPGRRVRAGQLLGYVGSTGNTTGPHLHLEVRPGGGEPVDPEVALAAHGLRP